MPSFATLTADRDFEEHCGIDKGPITTPVWLTGLWIALFIIRPWEIMIPELREIRFERVYALTVLSVVFVSGLAQFRGCMQTYAVLFFLSILAASTVFAYNTTIAWTHFYTYLTLVVFYFVLLSVIRTPHQLEFIITCYIATMAIYLGKAQWEYFVYGHHQFTMGVPRLLGVDATFGGPNSVASSTVVSLPFLQFLWWHRHDITLSWPVFVRRCFPGFLIVYLILAVTSIILTNSRSGAVGFTVFVVLFGKLQPRFHKKIKRSIVTVLLLGVVWTLMPEVTKGRLTTLWNPEAGPKSAQGSVEGRKESFLAGLAMFSQHPVIGVGLGNTALYRSRFIDGQPVSPHNLYGEVLGETGTIGVAAFVFLIASLFANIRATRALAEHCVHPTTTMLSDVATSCGYVIVLLLVSGMAGAGMVRFQWLWLAAFALIGRNLSESIACDEMEQLELAEANADLHYYPN